MILTLCELLVIMPNPQTPIKPSIAGRSAGAGPPLDEKFCLRCSKRVHARLVGSHDLGCGWKGAGTKCEYCAGPSIKKPCMGVSQSCLSVRT
jgi:hypothetical protein